MSLIGGEGIEALQKTPHPQRSLLMKTIHFIQFPTLESSITNKFKVVRIHAQVPESRYIYSIICL